MHKRIARITKLGSKNNSVNRIIVSLTSKRSNGVCIKKLGCVINHYYGHSKFENITLNNMQLGIFMNNGLFIKKVLKKIINKYAL